jgi:hypothetical protein
MYDPTDERGVPTSRGVPRIVFVAAAVGLLAIFAVGFDTIFLSWYGHSFPWQNALRIPLDGSYKP